MLSKFRLAALLGFTCLASTVSVSSYAGTPPVPSLATLTPGSTEPLPQLHAIDTSRLASQLDTFTAAGAQTTQGQQFPAASKAKKMMTAAESTAAETAVSSTRMTAMSAAKDSATIAGVCQAYFDQSQALAPSLSAGFQAMASKDPAKMAAALPELEKQLAGLVPYEIRAEACGGDHINAYTDYQYFELSALRSRGVDIGLPANLPIVKQPDMNQGPLAFAVGWIKYEQKDFNGALAAFSKGLAMYPHEHGLQNEYIASLIELRRGQDVVTFVDGVFENTNDLTDELRGSLFVSRALGLLMIGAFDAADESFTVSLYYRYDENIVKLRDEVRAAIIAAKAKK